ncbi:MAG: transcription initiation factor IIB [Nitrosopumilus sp.]|nr:transcription initiation factor IIB [Nitrosopumilus sp.]
MSLQETLCPRCRKNSVVTDIESHEIFCSKCGMVIEERVSDQRPERTFANSTSNKSHTGGKTSLTKHDRGLRTMINPFDKDSTGNSLSSSMKLSMKRLRKWDARSMKKHDERSLQFALSEMLKIKEKLSLPDAVIEKASYIYRKALEKKLIRGRSISAVAAASLYAACRESETPRTTREIASAMGIKIKEVTASYRLIFKELELKVPVVDSVLCISKIASNANVSEKTKRFAMKLLKKAKKQNMLAGKHPMGVAASALYIASINLEENRTQKEIADAAGITEVTVRNRCKSLKKLA